MESETDLLPVMTSQIDLPSKLSNPHKRKRRELEYDIASSSDPALFSSDDHTPGAENYESKRRKQKWRGTWWGEKHPRCGSSTAPQRKFTRNFDSGVWMGSDETGASLTNEFLEDTRPALEETSPLMFSLGKSDQRGIDRATDATSLEEIPELKTHQPSARTLASDGAPSCPDYTAINHVIDSCLEAGEENVDLSSMAADSIPNEGLRRLRSLTRHGTMQNTPPSQEAYVPMEPALRLYLSNNTIRTFPSEILSLTNLRVLSLRHNKLTWIPPALATLPHLEHLNIAGNKLKRLPFELLRLYERSPFAMIANPNPFDEIQPDQVIADWDCNLQPIALNSPVARSFPSYFHPDGSGATSTLPRTTARSPSLVEMALRKCQSLQDLASIRDWCASGEGPASLSRLLSAAHGANQYGYSECPSCGRSFIIPRAEWTEWWDLRTRTRGSDPIETCASFSARVAFVRQVCSWACVEGVVGSR